MLFLLLVSGISSVVERALLAATQQRQSPVNASLFGLLNFALDGVKLFSKILQTTSVALTVLTVISVLFVEAIITDAQFAVTDLAVLTLLQFPFWAFAVTLEVVSMSSFSSVQNSYVSLAYVRLFEIFALAEVVVSVVILVGFGLKYLQSSSATFIPMIGITHFQAGIGINVLLGIFPLILFVAEKVPFDLVEAESEIIDGITTEFDGFAFSLVYAAEVSVGFVVLKLFLGSAG